MKNRRGLPVVVFLSWWLCISVFATVREEYTIKAAFMGKFPQFIQWPDKSGMTDTSKPFVIGVIGEDPFGSILEKCYAGKNRKIKNKKVKIKYVKSLEEIPGCHLLFISRSVENDLLKILSITKNKPILTIGETQGFAQKGVHINFYISQKRIRFEINPLAIRESSLSVDSLLLEFAKTIKPGEK